MNGENVTAVRVPVRDDAAGYAMSVRLHRSFADAVPRVREALRLQGFGVLTEIDVAAVMREKLGAVMGPYLILGACNPALAHRALEAEPNLGLLLPCNVVIREDGDATLVQALDPSVIAGVAHSDAAREVAAEARQRLEAALESLPDLTLSAEPAEAQRHRSVTIPLAYSALDIERAAESLHVTLSDEETDAILARIGGELEELGASATRSALMARIYDEVAHVAHLHTCSDDG